MSAQSPEADGIVTITPTENGPYEVVGDVRIVSPDGTVLRETAKAYLCRCGHSQNKPFCDSSHRRIGWTEVSDSEDSAE
ncbi:MAG: CDGSH iron-sulfur domain-containing protein [Actinomycetota bacterium]|nr:CDGSH iron-sulfur domain-containing protein [Actinomycetota bacterium]